MYQTDYIILVLKCQMYQFKFPVNAEFLRLLFRVNFYCIFKEIQICIHNMIFYIFSINLFYTKKKASGHKY